MAVIAIRQRSGAPRSPVQWDLIAGATPNKKVESTDRVDLAKRFADQAAIDAYVTANNGVVAEWKAMTLPAGID
jgi:hypothetical protein